MLIQRAKFLFDLNVIMSFESESQHEGIGKKSIKTKAQRVFICSEMEEVIL